MTSSKSKSKAICGSQNGAILIWFVIFLPILIGMVAMAFDVTRLAVAKNELQNAADAGALAAARVLYNDEGTAVNPGANQIGTAAATANMSENAAVEVNAGDVQRGHWSFGMGALPRGFTPNPSLSPVSLWEVSTEELDADPNFINAVQVTARRESTPIFSYFARIFGIDSWTMSATAVAYIGYSGTLDPGEADQPIAICRQALTNPEGEYTCSIGRMLNSGPDPSTSNTAGWTNFSQPCDTANASEMRGLICAGGNPNPINYEEPIGAVGGVQDNVFRELRDCWIESAPSLNEDDGLPNQPWELMLPVIDCPGNNVSNCAEQRGAVTVLVIFMSPEGGTPDVDEAPREMINVPGYANWSNTSPDGQVRWESFVDHFNLENADGSTAPYDKKSIYFMPDCTYHDRTGRTGGENYGVLAKYPVLVD
jgi:hypothetical protein